MVPDCPRCEHRRSPPTRSRLGIPAMWTDPSVFLQARSEGSEDDGSSSRRPRPGRSPATSPWPSPPTPSYATGPRRRRGLYPRRGPCPPSSAREAEILETFSGPGSSPSASAPTTARCSRATDARGGPLPILADAFVTTEDGTGIVHLAPAFGEDDYRVAAASPRVPFDPTRAGTLYNPVLPDGTYDARRATATGAPSRAARSRTPGVTAALIEDLRARGLLLQGRRLRAFLSALLALRHTPPLLRQTVLVHRHIEPPRAAARGQRDGRLASALTSRRGVSGTG